VLPLRAYYTAKPWLPWRFRIALRQILARRILKRCGDVWPILESAGRKPDGWPGWPEGKQFAFVLTHDVESQVGLGRVRPLAELEMSLGFRSSFNFIPEGEYRVPEDLRTWLTDNGFEVGVHDHRHDGRLYRSREDFRRSAERINHYLKEWNAVGFRSGFMLHNLDWIHDLEVEYDSSTFDTDPFEPQPDGVGTIFPFWVPAPKRVEDGGRRTENGGKAHPDSASSVFRRLSSGENGYVELPYTLAQDSTLFLVLGGTSPEIWKRKLDWIAEKGGMALLNLHPDYLRFLGAPQTPDTFPVRNYSEFLKTVRSRYAGSYWSPLPKEVAHFVRRHANGPLGMRTRRDDVKQATSKTKIWIDLENTPHIPFFKPIIRELEKRGCRVVLTARDAYQTCEMADRYGLAYTRIGRHYGKRRLLKAWGLFARGLQLLPFAVREKPSLAVNHGSRTQTLICNALGIPTVTIMDYEHAAGLFFLRPLWQIVPDVVRNDSVHFRRKGGMRKYSGIKEDVYVPDFAPDPAILRQLGLQGASIVVTVRPPATEAHYHNPESEALFVSVMNRLSSTTGVRTVLLPRNKRQEAEIKANWPQWFADAKVIIPEQVVEGLNLLWFSDLVVSGGGTMNREAAALGVPVYSIFRGEIGAVDHHLQADGRLVLIESVQDVQDKIHLTARPKGAQADLPPRKALAEIVAHIDDILESPYSR
jgi:hypothetical protein